MSKTENKKKNVYGKPNYWLKKEFKVQFYFLKPNITK